MKTRKRFLCFFLALILSLSCGISGCGQTSKIRYTEDGRVILRVSMYNSSSYPLWRSYVEEHCPDVFIEWENNRNTAANVLYLAEHDDMPDIVSIRRFEYDTTAKLRPYLTDLSSLPLTSSYDPQYLAPFASNGKQYWLPGPGVIDGIVANTDLFKQYGVAVPTDMDSFIKACAQLEEHDVAVFAADCSETWSATQLIQGFGATELSGEGSSWIKQFEDGTASSVDTAAFSKIASVLRLLSENRILTQEDLDSSAADTSEMLIRGKAAMVRKASDEKFDASGTHHYAALPFFGETADDNRLCTYPVFSLAMSNKLQSDPKLLSAGREVLSVMLSRDAQETLNESGEGLISYNSGSELPLSSAMQSVRSLIKENKCFIRVLNSNTFSANTLALTALVAKDADDSTFISVLNENLFKKPDTAPVAVSNVEAVSQLNSDRCSPSGSVAAQVIQKETGTDCVLIDTRETPSTIFRGPYTKADINAVVLPSKAYKGTLSRGELLSLLDTALLSATTFQSGQTEPIVEYPVAAGMTVVMKRDGTVLDVSLSEKEKNWSDCTVTISESVYKALKELSNPLFDHFEPTEKTLQQYFLAGFQAAGGLPAAQNYYRIG